MSFASTARKDLGKVAKTRVVCLNSYGTLVGIHMGLLWVFWRLAPFVIKFSGFLHVILEAFQARFRFVH